MAQVELDINWKFTVSSKEAALILAALSNHLNSEKKLEAAKELRDKITLYQASQARIFIRDMEAHADTVETNVRPER